MNIKNRDSSMCWKERWYEIYIVYGVYSLVNFIFINLHLSLCTVLSDIISITECIRVAHSLYHKTCIHDAIILFLLSHLP